jgi:hypothetical protein
MSAATVFVYCDNHNTRIPVADFAWADGRWSGVGGSDSSVRITSGIVVTGPANGGAYTRRRYVLRCRKRRCRQSVVVNGEAKLFRLLDDVVARGDSSVSLSEIAANI